MTELTATPIPADELQDILDADVEALLNNENELEFQDAWAILFAAIDRALDAHKPR
ncbi:hypothetical protein HT136_08535 [Novosphingobium profundi]|uniref:hypothetical protein n=1 Tax=Novosphingobium profundi TaxID=1774954 RepID=UPI001BD9576B|nr:hypothetical protein [Novosphingobium profundi]MBT0668415.1 hypothetical protein [Novosphingobium profundi]